MEFDRSKVYTALNAEELKVGYINYLLLGHVNDGIVYHDPLEKTNNPDLDVVYHLVAEVDYSAMDLDVESGIEIGKANKDSHGYFFGIRRMAIGYSLVMYQYDSSEEYTLQTYDESSLRMNLELSIHNNGNIDFNEFKKYVKEIILKILEQM